MKRRVDPRGDYALVPLTQGFVAIVDIEDARRVSGHCWQVWGVKRRTQYAKTKIGKKTVFLHQFVKPTESPFEIDHEDGDGLNCRRGNLVSKSHGDNLRNSYRHRELARTALKEVLGSV